MAIIPPRINTFLRLVGNVLFLNMPFRAYNFFLSTFSRVAYETRNATSASTAGKAEHLLQSPGCSEWNEVLNTQSATCRELLDTFVGTKVSDFYLSCYGEFDMTQTRIVPIKLFNPFLI